MQTHHFGQFPLPPVKAKENVWPKAQGQGHVEDIQGPRAQLGGIVARQSNRGLPSLVGNRPKLKDPCGHVLFKASTHRLCFAQSPIGRPLARKQKPLDRIRELNLAKFR